MESPPAPLADASVEWIAGRYRVEAVLGRGGMAVVYRVTDTVAGRELALKQLVPLEGKKAREASVLFAREFHTLAQLSHPHVIEVYDYGIDACGAYYTMELLDGRDLRELSPMPWREACVRLLDVCSSLSLLHSRRLIHRDVSPRNVRCTKDGASKLIDFGALAPMGAGGRLVGTPPFVAPEVVHRLATDARVDLFALGATLYYTLTGRHAYPARTFSELPEVWATKAPLPSRLVPDVPPALDALVMSLLSLEPAMRPRTAFEVMQRLAAVADVERVEPVSVAQAYLSTPLLIGRDELLAEIRARIAAAADGRGDAVRIEGPAGAGRTRALDACVLDAKTLGATVLRASATEGGSVDFGVARVLAERLNEAFPSEATSAASGADPGLQALLARASSKQPVMLAVDDVHRMDAPSAAVLASLAAEAHEGRVLLVVTMESDTASDAPALAVLARRCSPLALAPLTSEQTVELFKSVFGDVPNAALVSARIYEVARGNPRESMELAQHLIDKGAIVYAGGAWALPGELSAPDLPTSAGQVFLARVAALSPLARFLAETQSLVVHGTFTREDYGSLAGDSAAQEVDAAINELLSKQVVVGDGRLYALAHGTRASALTLQLDAGDLARRHLALSRLYEHDEAYVLVAAHHLLSAGVHERALDRVQQLTAAADEKGGIVALPQLGRELRRSIFERALACAVQLGRTPREQHELRRWLTGISIVTDETVYWHAAQAWREQLKRDTGLVDYRELHDVSDPAERLKRAFQRALDRYEATPETERVYRPDEALRALVQYVAISIAVGARTLDGKLLASLEPLLEPFAPLSPLIDAMWHNAICTFEVNCGGKQDRARLRAIELYDRLGKFNETELRNVSVIRRALAYCAGAIEAGLGLPSAMRWATILDDDPLQKVNAMHIRKVARLQQGDVEGAERYGRQAEQLAAEASLPQMFASSALELAAYTLAHDLTGLKQTIDKIEPLASRHAGWVPVRHLAEGEFQRLRGNLDAALAAYERCLVLAAPEPAEPWRSLRAWPNAIAGSMAVLLELGRSEEAKLRGEQALTVGRARDMRVALHPISRALALAEARLGDYPGAHARLAEVIAEQRELGVSGLNLGASYEACARIAIWAGDSAAVEEYGLLTAREYRHGLGSPLGVLYERLLDDARRAGMNELPQLSTLEATQVSASDDISRAQIATEVTVSWSGAEAARGRAARKPRRRQTPKSK